MKLNVRQIDGKDVYKDIIRINENYRKDSEGNKFEEGQVYLVKVNTGKKAYAILRGKIDSTNPEIFMDDILRNRLKIDENQEYDFNFSRLGWWDDFGWAWGATEPAYRIAIKLSSISLLITFISLVVTLLITFKK